MTEEGALILGIIAGVQIVLMCIMAVMLIITFMR